MSNGVYGKGMQLKDSDGNLYKVDEYTNQKKYYTLMKLEKPITYRFPVYHREIIEEYRIPGTPYKVEQKIQDEQGNIYYIKSAYLDIKVVGSKNFFNPIFRIKKDRNFFSEDISDKHLKENGYLFSVIVGDLEVNEKYKFDDYENMELVSKKFDKDIYNLTFKNAEMEDEVPIEVKDDSKNKYRFYQYPPHKEDTWQNAKEGWRKIRTGGKKTRRKKLTRKGKKSSKKWTRKRKMSSKVLRGH